MDIRRMIICAAALCLTACTAPRETGAAGNAAGTAPADSTRIHLDSGGVTAEGAGVRVSGMYADIVAAGTYVIDGSAEGCMITVKAGKKDTVTLVLDGADISNPAGAAIYTENAGLTRIVINKGTENTVKSGSPGKAADKNAEGAAIWSKDDLLITGEGTLRVFGYINNGIQTSDNFTAEGGNIYAEAVNNGVKGKDSAVFSGGCFEIKAGGDGIKSGGGDTDDTADDGGKGIVTISGGTLNITAAGDGIQAQTVLELSGGVINVETGGGSADNKKVGGTRKDKNESSAKGFKAGTAINISGGVINADTFDDCFHSDGELTMTGGTLTVAAGDNAMRGGKMLSISGGTADISRCCEGIEANKIYLTGGVINVTASDDGINANGGPDTDFGGFGGFGGGRGNKPDRPDMSDDPDRGERPERTGRPKAEFPADMPDPPGDMPQGEPPADMPPTGGMAGGMTVSEEEMPEINISGGAIYVNAGGDGLDSNGNITVSGGSVIVDGPDNDGNGAIDAGTEIGGRAVISGGAVLAVGSSGMAETFGSGSEQCSFIYYLPETLPAGQTIEIRSAGGETLISHKTVKKVSSVVFSDPRLAAGGEYTLICGGNEYTVKQDSVSVQAGERRGFGHWR